MLRQFKIILVGALLGLMVFTSSVFASKPNSFENSVMLLIFNNTDIANVGDAAGLQNSVTAGSVYVSLHSGDPGETGTQATSECAYTSYARVAVARSGAAWTVTNNSAANAAAITFPAATGSSCTATYFCVGLESSGATVAAYCGALTASLAITSGITPSFAISGLTITED